MATKQKLRFSSILKFWVHLLWMKAVIDATPNSIQFNFTFSENVFKFLNACCVFHMNSEFSKLSSPVQIMERISRKQKLHNKFSTQNQSSVPCILFISRNV